MIAKIAIQQYLEEHQRNFHSLKQAGESQLDQAIESLVPSPTFVTPLYKHQKVGFLLGIKYPGLLLLSDMGTGKTKIALDIIRWRIAHGSLRRVLVLVPNTVNIESWRQECKNHAPDLRVEYTINSKGRSNLLNADIYISTYAGWLRRVTHTEGNRWKLSESKIRLLLEAFDGIVYDESTNLMNWQSLTFKACRAMLPGMRWRLGMTGTPFGRDLQSLWSQFYAIDSGGALGTTLGVYRAAFFTEKKNVWGGCDYTFRQARLDQLKRRMKHSSVRYHISECADLPQKVYSRRAVTFTKQQWAYYEKILDRVRVADDPESRNNVYMAMRQLTGGFLYVQGSAEIIKFDPNPKLDALIALLEELDPKEKVVVYNQFIHSGKLIQERLTAKGISSARIYGGTRDKAEELRRFLEKSSCRVLVANAQSAAMGLNLQTVRYLVFYETPSSVIVREQAERRVWRPGQTRTVVYYDLFVRGSIEQKLLDYLSEGKDLYKAVLSGSEVACGGPIGLISEAERIKRLASLSSDRPGSRPRRVTKARKAVRTRGRLRLTRQT